ncbi:MAG TPA: TIGR00730 family Rossman fold protein [Candidatus Polarisedimenticolia bacterium]|nr:TIGR00730 family Rossman fold protein [Candidatus Polarisedimenticolia bacterium]
MHTKNEKQRIERLKSSPAYVRAYEDLAFLHREDLRPVRLQLELMKPELHLQEQGITSTVVVFGSTRTLERAEIKPILKNLEQRAAASPKNASLAAELARTRRLLAKSKYYDEAREFARMVSSTCQLDGQCDYVIVTGGGPGIMEAANRGAYDVGGKSIGLNITLPEEQFPNPYITPELCFQFHYFGLRKMHFLKRARALVAFPGGYGTLDELTETLCLVQTRKIEPIPIVLVCESFWRRALDVEFLAEEGMIAPEDREIIAYAETAPEIWKIIQDFHRT